MLNYNCDSVGRLPTTEKDLSMTSNIRTFDYHSAPGRQLPSFAEALNWNAMMLPVVKAFLDAREPGTTAVQSKYLGDVWGGLMNTIDVDDELTCMPSSVDFTMPVHFVPIIRRTAAVTAAFAFCELVKQLQSVQDLGDDIVVQEAMRKGWRAFETRAQEANKVQEGFGCDNTQSWMTLRDIGEAPKSKDLKNKMLAIAKLAGRMFNSFSYMHRDQPNDDPEEVVGATMGPELDRVLDSEMAMLADPDTEDLAAMKILEHRAPITEMAGKENKNRGPLVLLVDESGSMHDGDLGEHIWAGAAKWAGRNTWAKACSVALTRIAWAENRPVRVVHFGNATIVQELPKDDMRALFEMARSFLSGGTAFGPALNRARAVVGDLEADGFEGADIVLITDGSEPDYASHNRQIDHMDKDSIKLWTIAIGEDIDRKAPVRTRCEKYTYAADRMLSNPDTAVHLAAGLDKAAMGHADGEGGMLN